MSFDVVVCKKCGIERNRRLRGRSQAGKLRFEDDFGSLWSSTNVCAICRRHQESSGYSRAEFPKNCNARNGRFGEIRALEWLLSRGYKDVKHLGGPGQPDILFTDSSGIVRSVEVKIATNVCGKHWQTKPVAESRISDDYVAIVFPSGRVHMVPMAEHLSHCAPRGTRAVTNLVRGDAVAS